MLATVCSRRLERCVLERKFREMPGFGAEAELEMLCQGERGEREQSLGKKRALACSVDKCLHVSF